MSPSFAGVFTLLFIIFGALLVAWIMLRVMDKEKDRKR